MNALLLLGQTEAANVTLTTGGAVMMILCVGLVLGLNVFCLSRILRPANPSAHHHAPQETNTHDRET